MREIDKIIIHCSDTPAGQKVTVADIRRWHLARGFADIGYHFVVYLDGSIHRGRPLSQIGAHCLGQNRNSIGICYIGGRASKDPKSYADTRTPQQKEALRALVADLRRKYPGATVHGHREFAAKACPCFNVNTDL